MQRKERVRENVKYYEIEKHCGKKECRTRWIQIQEPWRYDTIFMPFACTETWWEGEISLGKTAIFHLKLAEQSCATEINEAPDWLMRHLIESFKMWSVIFYFFVYLDVIWVKKMAFWRPNNYPPNTNDTDNQQWSAMKQQKNTFFLHRVNNRADKVDYCH